MSTHEIIDAAMSLPPEEKARLAEQLLASLDSREQQQVDEEWAAEVEQRIDDLDAGRIQTIPGEEVFRRLANRKRG